MYGLRDRSGASLLTAAQRSKQGSLRFRYGRGENYFVAYKRRTLVWTNPYAMRRQSVIAVCRLMSSFGSYFFRSEEKLLGPGHFLSRDCVLA